MGSFTKFEKRKADIKHKKKRSKQAFALLQVLLLPVWQGVELDSTHLEKFLGTERTTTQLRRTKNKTQQADHLWGAGPSRKRQADVEESYFEILVRQVVLQPQRVDALWWRLPGQLLDGVLLPAQLGQRILHQHHFGLGVLGLCMCVRVREDIKQKKMWVKYIFFYLKQHYWLSCLWQYYYLVPVMTNWLVTGRLMQLSSTHCPLLVEHRPT